MFIKYEKSKWSKEQLKDYCYQYNIGVSGTKDELLERLGIYAKKKLEKKKNFDLYHKKKREEKEKIKEEEERLKQKK